MTIQLTELQLTDKSLVNQRGRNVFDQVIYYLIIQNTKYLNLIQIIRNFCCLIYNLIGYFDYFLFLKSLNICRQQFQVNCNIHKHISHCEGECDHQEHVGSLIDLEFW